MPVPELLGERLRNSAILLAGALVIAIPLGIAVGLISAIRRYSLFDRASMGATLIAANIPTFVFGLGLVIVFAVQLRWFPVQGMHRPARRGRPLRSPEPSGPAGADDSDPAGGDHRPHGALVDAGDR